MNKFVRFSLVGCLMLLSTICTLNIPSGISVNAETEYTSKAYCLMEYGTGQVLKDNNADKMLPIASVTKTMTLLLAFEALDNGTLTMDKILMASANASGMGGSQVFIDANSEYSVKDLLTAIVISSANDASVVIAEELGGSEEGFVNLMNKRASELGMQNTNYVNCTGLPANNHYSTARDVAVVMRALLKHQEYFTLSGIWMQDFVHPSGRITEMANTNKLIRNYRGCDAGKTGSTNEAGYCLSASAKRNDMRLISVVLGADNSKIRFSECSSLFDWGFANFESKCLVNSEADMETLAPIKKASIKEINAKPARDYWDLVVKGAKSNKVVNYEYDNASAPINKGDRVGQVVITENGVVLDSIELLADTNVNARNYGESFDEVLNNWKIKK